VTIIAQLDFENAYSGGKCSKDDFEDWSPTDVHGSCVLGKQVIYSRRKAGRACWFGEAHDHFSFVKNCICTLEDFECEHCFMYDENQKECVFYCKKDRLEIQKLEIDLSKPCTNNYRRVTKGYKKVPGDTCDDVLFSKPKGLVSCDIYPNPSIVDIIAENPTASIIIGIIATTLILATTGMCLYKKNKKFHNFIRYTFNIGEDTEIDYRSLRLSDDLDSE